MVGASLDDQADQKAFVEKHDLPFAMLCDTDRSMARAYGVLRPGFTSRVTFLIDDKGAVSKVWPRVDPATHAAEVIEALKSLNR